MGGELNLPQPNASHQSDRSPWLPGALITSLLFVIGKQLMGLYFARTSFGLTYSAAGSPMVVLLWIYYSALLLFWGAEFSKVYTKTVGSQRNRQF